MRRVIDAHMHLYPPRRLGGLMRWVRRAVPGHPVPADITVGETVAGLRAAGVKSFFAAVFPLAPGEARELNRFNTELARSIPGMIALGTAHQDDDDPGAVAAEALGPLGLKGIKLHPLMMKMAPADPRMAGVYAAAQEAGRPVLIHTGFEEGRARTSEKEQWERLFAAYPRLTFLLAHAFFPDLAYAFSLLPRFENVLLDLANVIGLLRWDRANGPLPFGMPRPAWGEREFAAALDANASRVLFGSDYPAGMGTIEDIVRQVETIGLEKQSLEKILYGNARALIDRLGLR